MLSCTDNSCWLTLGLRDIFHRISIFILQLMQMACELSSICLLIVDFWSQNPSTFLLYTCSFLCFLLKNSSSRGLQARDEGHTHTLTFCTLHISSKWIFHALLVTKQPVPEHCLSPLWKASGCSSAALSAFYTDWTLPWSRPIHEPRGAVKGETEETYTSWLRGGSLLSLLVLRLKEQREHVLQPRQLLRIMWQPIAVERWDTVWQIYQEMLNGRKLFNHNYPSEHSALQVAWSVLWPEAKSVWERLSSPTNTK